MPTDLGGSSTDRSDPPSKGRRLPHLIRLREAAEITGLPLSLLRKSFMAAEKRPPNVPCPPPHKRIGRAVYILADRLGDWIAALEAPNRRRKSSTARRIEKR